MMDQDSVSLFSWVANCQAPTWPSIASLWFHQQTSFLREELSRPWKCHLKEWIIWSNVGKCNIILNILTEQKLAYHSLCVPWPHSFGSTQNPNLHISAILSPAACKRWFLRFLWDLSILRYIYYLSQSIMSIMHVDAKINHEWYMVQNINKEG